MITKLFADGGVIEKNPSTIGGTWAWILVNDQDLQVSFGTGCITPSRARVESVTNNLTELLALLHGLEHLPVDFAGTVYSDSQISLGRIFLGWKWKNVPRWVHELYQETRKRLFNWEMIKFVLLDGHPTKAQLAAGVGKRGHPVSIYNVQCDKLCGETAENHLRSIEESKISAVSLPEELHPGVNTALMGEGVVVTHERVTDSMGKFHGLLKLVLQGEDDYPNLELWRELMAVGSVIYGVQRDPDLARRLIIFYRIKDGQYDDVHDYR